MKKWYVNSIGTEITWKCNQQGVTLTDTIIITDNGVPVELNDIIKEGYTYDTVSDGMMC